MSLRKRGDFMNIDIVIGLFALLISCLSLFISLYYNKKDHERRRKQATIEYFEEMTSKLYDSQAKFNNKFNQLDVDISELDTNIELLKNATEILAAFERLSVGVNTKIFDLDILDRMAGSYLMVMYTRFAPYIAKVRTDASRVNSYQEFENVVDCIKKKRRILNERGNI